MSLDSQDQINDFVRDIAPYFEVAEGVPSAQQSWPIPDEPLNADGFRAMFQHMRGIFGRGGRPYWLYFNGGPANTNATNTRLLTVSTVTGTAEATLWGTFHRMTEDLVLEFPPVTSPTDQHVVLEYDPVRAGEGGLPIEAKVVTSLNRTQGKDYLLLWTIHRRPNQLLADAERTRHRPFVAPTVTYNWASELPDPSTLISGTTAIIRRDRSMLMSMQALEPDGTDDEAEPPARWVDLSDPQWESFSLNTFYASRPVAPVQIQRKGKRRELRGSLRRVDDRVFDGSFSEGYYIAYLSSGDRPRYQKRSIVATATALPMGRWGHVVVNTDGTIYFYPGTDRGTSWITVDNVYWDVE